MPDHPGQGHSCVDPKAFVIDTWRPISADRTSQNGTFLAVQRHTQIAVNVHRVTAERFPRPYLFHCDDDQCEIILKTPVAEADHLFLNCGKHFGSA